MIYTEVHDVVGERADEGLSQVQVTVTDVLAEYAEPFIDMLAVVAGASGPDYDPEHALAHMVHRGVTAAVGEPLRALCGKSWSPTVVGPDAAIGRPDCRYCIAVARIAVMFDLHLTPRAEEPTT